MLPERTKNFVSPYPPAAAPAAPTAAPVAILPPAERLLTRNDIMASHKALLEMYEQQQADIADGWGGHRWEVGSHQAPSNSQAPNTGLYLATNIVLTGMTIGGIAMITWLLGAGPAWAIAGWIAGTGIVALCLVRRQHDAALAHSPIGLARLIAEQTFDLLAAGQDEHYALLEDERADARERRAAKVAAAQAWMMPAVHTVHTQNFTKMTHQNSYGGSDAEQSSGNDDADADDADIPAWLRQPPVRRAIGTTQQAAAPAAPAAPQEAPTAPQWAAALLAWAAACHDGLGPNGLIIRATPWAARSPWPVADKRAMLAALTAAPAIVVAAGDGIGGGRYRLDIVAYPDTAALLAVLGHRLGTV